MSLWEDCEKLIARGELSATDATGYPFLLKVGNDETKSYLRNCMAMHFGTWLQANPNIMDFRMVVDFGEIKGSVMIDVHRAANIWIIFGKKKDRKKFADWLSSYRNWFHDIPIERTWLPEVPSSGVHRWCLVPHAKCGAFNPFSAEDEFSEDFFERWAWIIENCKKPVYVLNNKGFAFTRPSDAVLYKMMWSDRDAG